MEKSGVVSWLHLHPCCFYSEEQDACSEAGGSNRDPAASFACRFGGRDLLCTVLLKFASRKESCDHELILKLVYREGGIRLMVPLLCCRTRSVVSHAIRCFQQNLFFSTSFCSSWHQQPSHD